MNRTNISGAIKPLQFLLGTWKSTSAKGQYVDRVPAFEYHEELSFTTCGQPMLNYKSESWHPTTRRPMHLESGFLRIKPDSNITFFVAHNFGISTVEEGTVDANTNTICLKTTSINRSIDNARDPKVTGVERIIKLLENGNLHIRTSMSTSLTPEMSEHLEVVYVKCNKQ